MSADRQLDLDGVGERGYVTPSPLDGLLATPKQRDAELYRVPHVRIGIVVGSRMQRFDWTVEEAMAVATGHPVYGAAARRDLFDALQRALPGRKW